MSDEVTILMENSHRVEMEMAAKLIDHRGNIRRLEAIRAQKGIAFAADKPA
ncbi:hypothetical protein [Rhizobium sp. Leaf371]|uniref:hypothetical protein n=1 Tax=Rhizobium sp. Leaf371 TaxID=1736355 RepID=UPI001AEC1013|nr:hypothetical protein [Rhizobium sp. Leaf371]